MDYKEKSFAAATETSKLLITLSTGVLAFCITLLNPEQGKQPSMVPVTTAEKALLACSWFVLLLCTGCGIWTQLSITHVLSKGNDSSAPDIWDWKIRFPYIFQILVFIAGMAMLVVYGGLRLCH